MKKNNSEFIPEGHVIGLGMYIVNCLDKYIEVDLLFRDQRGISFKVRKKILRTEMKH